MQTANIGSVLRATYVQAAVVQLVVAGSFVLARAAR
eukprot:COSAG02_NODE_67165_length_253_cov_1.324675_2_plen_35_part_01